MESTDTLTKPYGAIAVYRTGQPAKIVAQFDDRVAAVAFVERASARYDAVELIERQS